MTCWIKNGDAKEIINPPLYTKLPARNLKCFGNRLVKIEGINAQGVLAKKAKSI